MPRMDVGATVGAPPRSTLLFTDIEGSTRQWEESAARCSTRSSPLRRAAHRGRRGRRHGVRHARRWDRGGVLVGGRGAAGRRRRAARARAARTSTCAWVSTPERWSRRRGPAGPVGQPGRAGDGAGARGPDPPVRRHRRAGPLGAQPRRPRRPRHPPLPRPRRARADLAGSPPGAERTRSRPSGASTPTRTTSRGNGRRSSGRDADLREPRRRRCGPTVS